MTSEARVIALDRLRPGDVASRSGDLLDVVFGWADFHPVAAAGGGPVRGRGPERIAA